MLTKHGGMKMFKPVRLVATIVFLGSIGLVFVGAFVLGNEVCHQDLLCRVSLVLRNAAPPLGSLHR